MIQREFDAYENSANGEMKILYRLANFYISYFHELAVLKDSAYKIICDEKRRITRTIKKQYRWIQGCKQFDIRKKL